MQVQKILPKKNTVNYITINTQTIVGVFISVTRQLIIKGNTPQRGGREVKGIV